MMIKLFPAIILGLIALAVIVTAAYIVVKMDEDRDDLG